MQIPIIETERLILQAPDSSCDHAYQQFYTDPDASHFYGGPLTPQAAWARLAAVLGNWHLQGFGVWALREKATGSIIGTCGFWQGKGWPRELTWWIDPQSRGKGYALEASQAAIAHAYDVFAWTSVETYMNDTNLAARGLVEKLGGSKIERRSFPDGMERDYFHIPRRM